MTRIDPFDSSANALVSLDNGGRFFNILTKADDGFISPAELAKAAGVYGEKQKMVVYFAMAIATLDAASKEKIISSLSPQLLETYNKYKPTSFLPSEAEAKGVLAASVVVTGIPKHIESKTTFQGFVIVPITTGKSVVMVMIPLMDKYDVYEVRDNASDHSFLIAHARGSEKLPEQKITVGGILKELKTSKREDGPATKFLESFYYTIAHE